MIDKNYHTSFMVNPGGYRERATPVPIPNTEVKPFFADGTAMETLWESRSLPGLESYIILKEDVY